MTYDRTCPRCNRPAEDTAPRVCCARCGTYHHAGCWTTECASCGAAQTIDQLDSARAATRHRGRVALMSLAAFVGTVLLGSFLLNIVSGDPFALFSLVRLGAIGVLWAAVWGLSRLVRP